MLCCRVGIYRGTFYAICGCFQRLVNCFYFGSFSVVLCAFSLICSTEGLLLSLTARWEIEWSMNSRRLSGEIPFQWV